MNKSQFFLLGFFLINGVLLFGNALIVSAHERGHATVCSQLKGNASVVIAWGGQSGHVLCEGLSPEQYDKFAERVAVQESTGYQLLAFWQAFCLLALGLLVLLGLKMEVK